MNANYIIKNYREWALVAIIFIASVITRMYGVGDWPLDGDEIFTYFDSLNNTYREDDKILSLHGAF